MSARWYKRCGADFIHGTMMLTLEEKGAYSLCLDLIYDRGGPIPDDARWLAGVCGVSLRKWSALRQRLIDCGKLTTDGEFIFNIRAGFELVSAELQARNLAESGAKGGRKRAENAAEIKKSNDLAQAALKLTRGDKIREEKPSKDGLARKGSIPQDWVPEPFAEATKSAAVIRTWDDSTFQAQLEQFKANHTAKGNLFSNFQSAWSTWVLNSPKFGGNGNGRQEPTGKTAATWAMLDQSDQPY